MPITISVAWANVGMVATGVRGSPAFGYNLGILDGPPPRRRQCHGRETAQPEIGNLVADPYALAPVPADTSVCRLVNPQIQSARSAPVSVATGFSNRPYKMQQTKLLAVPCVSPRVSLFRR